MDPYLRWLQLDPIWNDCNSPSFEMIAINPHLKWLQLDLIWNDCNQRSFEMTAISAQLKWLRMDFRNLRSAPANEFWEFGVSACEWFFGISVSACEWNFRNLHQCIEQIHPLEQVCWQSESTPRSKLPPGIILIGRVYVCIWYLISMILGVGNTGEAPKCATAGLSPAL